MTKTAFLHVICLNIKTIRIKQVVFFFKKMFIFAFRAVEYCGVRDACGGAGERRWEGLRSVTLDQVGAVRC